MLMNLTRMKEAKWLEHIVPYYDEYRYKITWGDQDLINIFFHFFPGKLFKMWLEVSNFKLLLKQNVFASSVKGCADWCRLDCSLHT